mmetsp:Transcript_60460/g.142636  ORF Transcript_60460/g.142636 Transcript_60460/m.142636 type:complete len:546 (-) Transcript_60460:374-2011(-)
MLAREVQRRAAPAFGRLVVWAARLVELRAGVDECRGQRRLLMKDRRLQRGRADQPRAGETRAVGAESVDVHAVRQQLQHLVVLVPLDRRKQRLARLEPHLGRLVARPVEPLVLDDGSWRVCRLLLRFRGRRLPPHQHCCHVSLHRLRIRHAPPRVLRDETLEDVKLDLAHRLPCLSLVPLFVEVDHLGERASCPAVHRVGQDFDHEMQHRHNHLPRLLEEDEELILGDGACLADVQRPEQPVQFGFGLVRVLALDEQEVGEDLDVIGADLSVVVGVVQFEHRVRHRVELRVIASDLDVLVDLHGVVDVHQACLLHLLVQVLLLPPLGKCHGALDKCILEHLPPRDPRFIFEERKLLEEPELKLVQLRAPSLEPEAEHGHALVSRLEEERYSVDGREKRLGVAHEQLLWRQLLVLVFVERLEGLVDKSVLRRLQKRSFQHVEDDDSKVLEDAGELGNHFQKLFVLEGPVAVLVNDHEHKLQPTVNHPLHVPHLSCLQEVQACIPLFTRDLAIVVVIDGSEEDDCDFRHNRVHNLARRLEEQLRSEL